MEKRTIRETLHTEFSPEGEWKLASYIEWLQGMVDETPEAHRGGLTIKFEAGWGEDRSTELTIYYKYEETEEQAAQREAEEAAERAQYAARQEASERATLEALKRKYESPAE